MSSLPPAFVRRSPFLSPGVWAANADHATVENCRGSAHSPITAVEQPSVCAAIVFRRNFRLRTAGGRGQRRASQKNALHFSVQRAGANRALFSLWLLSLLSKRKRESDNVSPACKRIEAVFLKAKKRFYFFLKAKRTFVFFSCLEARRTVLVTFSCVCSRESNQREERPVGSGALHKKSNPQAA